MRAGKAIQYVMGSVGVCRHRWRSQTKYGTWRTTRGFALYLVMLVTAVLFFLTLGAQDVTRLFTQSSRSSAFDTIAWHAADGGIERGRGQLALGIEKVALDYSWRIGDHQRCRVMVTSRHQAGASRQILATATVLEGDRVLAERFMSRPGPASHAVLPTTNKETRR